MYTRVIPICLGRSIHRQDGEDFKICVSGYFQIWAAVVKCIETRPPVYLVKDDHGEILEGTFYVEELQKVIKTDDVYKIEPIFKMRKMGQRVQYLVKWLGYPEPFSSWILKQDLQKHTTPTWSVSLANGTEWHGQCIVLCDLWKEDSTFGGRIFVSGTHSVHGYRSQHLQLDGQIGEQYLVDGLVEQLSGIPVT